MGAHLCLFYEQEPRFLEQWKVGGFHFCESVFVIGLPEIPGESWSGLKGIKSARELPSLPLVVLAPPGGVHYKGKEPLTTFKHPEDAIYVVGWNYAHHLSPQDLYPRAPGHLVYIPTLRESMMYSWVAANVALYDRLMKQNNV